MNRKNLPLLIMLTAGAVMCIISYVRRFSIPAKLVSLFVVLVVFYLLGSILAWTLDYFDRQNEERLKEEGEVIEKDGESMEDEQQSAEGERDKRNVAWEAKDGETAESDGR